MYPSHGCRRQTPESFLRMWAPLTNTCLQLQEGRRRRSGFESVALWMFADSLDHLGFILELSTRHLMFPLTWFQGFFLCGSICSQRLQETLCKCSKCCSCLASVFHILVTPGEGDTSLCFLDLLIHSSIVLSASMLIWKGSLLTPVVLTLPLSSLEGNTLTLLPQWSTHCTYEH